MSTFELLCTQDEIREAVIDSLQPGGYNRLRITSFTWENFSLDNDKKLNEFFAELRRRDIEVTILIGTTPKLNRWVRFFLPLEEIGVNLFFNGRVHSKLLLLESSERKEALIMSANISYGGLFYRHEVGVRFTNIQNENFSKLVTYFNKVLGSIETRGLKDVVQ